MKLTKTIATLLLLSSFIFQKINAQPECPNSAVEYLSANKVRAAITGGGDFFWGRGNSEFIVPFSPGTTNPISPFFANALWLGGIDEGGTLKVACQAYGNSNGQSDFWPGPIDQSTFNVLDNGCADYDRIWKTTRGDILQVINDFNDNGVINDPLPYSILAWPAIGNPHFEEALGFTLPDQELAPFFDRNSNGIYEPLNGEYPIIGEDFSNVLPDEMTWSVFNDIYYIHGETGGNPIGAEIHFMTYAFNCSEDDILNYTVFTRHKVINRSSANLQNFKAGIWNDSDIGCFANEYAGCDTTLQTGYSYIGNTNNTDPLCSPLIEFYEGSFPVLTTTFLNQDLSNYITYSNVAFNNPPIAITDPTDPIQFYNYLSGKWRDNTPLTFGGNGYDPSSTNTVNHIFHDNPNDPSGWSLENLSLDVYDRRAIMSTGNFDLPAGGQIILDAAYSYHWDADMMGLGNVDYALTNVPLIKNFYENGMNSGCSQFEFCETDCVWPGDANQDGIAKNVDLLYLGIAMGKNASGPARNPASFVWTPYKADNWAADLPADINAKNADFNGDGKLDSTDVAVLEINYRKTIPGFTEFDLPVPKEEGGIYIDFDKDEVSATGSIIERRVRGDINIASDAMPIPHLYGIAFTIKYDTSIWESSFGGLVQLDQNSFLGSQQETITTIYTGSGNGRIEVAVSRKDGQAIENANGKIGRLNLAIRKNTATGNTNGMQTLSVEIFNAFGVDNQENLFLLNGISDVVIGKDMTYDNTLTDVSEKINQTVNFELFPNPNNGVFNLFFEKTNFPSQIDIFDFSGKNIFSKKIPSHTEQFNIDFKNELPAGIYFIKWTLENGQFATKKIIIK